MKNILIAITFIISVSSFAQTKIGHVNSQELLDTLESRKQAIKQLDDFKLEGMKELQRLQDEGMKELQEMEKAFQAAYVIFQQKEKDLSPVLLKMEQDKLGRKQQELESRQQELEKGMQNYNQEIENNLQKRNEELITPILAMVKKAVAIVADRNKLSYIIDESATLYSKGGIDCTAEVMVELLKLDKEAIKKK
jgi:outer membrane protein